jgi:hypothetical protein
MTRLTTVCTALLVVFATAHVARAQDAPAPDPQDQRPAAIDYSDAHETRAKIHKIASWATLPLLGTEFLLGQKLYDSGTDDLRGVHGAVGAGLIGFFGVQSVTGVWNMVEARHAPGHKKRLVHGLIMLAAEGGLVAAAASAPSRARNGVLNGDASTHRNIAMVSIGVGTGGYLFMLLTGGSH